MRPRFALFFPTKLHLQFSPALSRSHKEKLSQRIKCISFFTACKARD